MAAVAQERRRLQEVDSVRQLAGVGDQYTEPICENGTEGCHGPDNLAGELPCSACFLGGDGADA